MKNDEFIIFGLREGSGKSGCTRWCSVTVGNGE